MAADKPATSEEWLWNKAKNMKLVKKILIMLMVGLVSFAAAFAAAWFTRPQPAQQVTQEQPGTTEPLGTNFAQVSNPGGHAISPSPEQGQPEVTRAMSERQLKSLVYEVRERIHAYDRKLKELDEREARLSTAQVTLKEDIETLNSLRVELAATVASLKEQRDALIASRTEIMAAEKTNLVAIAATYDKMDPASAGKILTNMCKAQVQAGQTRGGTFDDAVKILYYMTERTKAKLLAEMVNTEPQLAAVLCQKLKQVVEQQVQP